MQNIYFSRDDICIFKCPKIEEFHFRFLLSYKIDHVRIIWIAPFFLFDCENDEFLFDFVIQTDVEFIAATFTNQVCNIALLL